MTRRRSSARQASDSTLLSEWSGVPIVVRVDADTATRLHISVAELHARICDALASGRLAIWGAHADGQPVYRLRELQALLADEEAMADAAP